ncbi:leucine-rich repeat protein 1-like [Mercurialis annua]|uniref:leucine-rich repeat protein 1-like n=1 Tax=Mercurialis annua TaxID=3986 RepID=UPI0021600A51|nr:leucine-rich repeat protein 1-like [Mercurialis annua]
MASIMSNTFMFYAAIMLTLIPSGYGNADRDALIALKSSLTDPNSVLASWDPSLADPCTWFHVTCNPANQVTRVDLGKNNLSGRLVPNLNTLPSLEYMNMYENRIDGTIPAEFGDLKSLKSMDFAKNSISGTIPPTLGKLKSLLYLRLNNNRLTGPIPSEIATMSSLIVLDLSNNDLCGAIPRGLEHISTRKFENNPRLGHPC